MDVASPLQSRIDDRCSAHGQRAAAFATFELATKFFGADGPSPAALPGRPSAQGEGATP